MEKKFGLQKAIITLIRLALNLLHQQEYVECHSVTITVRQVENRQRLHLLRQSCMIDSDNVQELYLLSVP